MVSNGNRSNNHGDSDPLIAARIPASSEDKTTGKKRTFAWLSLRFQMPGRRQLEGFWTPGQRTNAWCGLIQYCVESFVYFLGPVLICLASAIIGLLVYTYFFIVKDMLALYYANTWYGHYIIASHSAFVVFLMISVVWNYALCVCTSNINGKSFNKVMRELAMATGFVFPETPAEVEQYRKDYEDRMILRMQCRRARAIEAANRTTNAAAQTKKAEENGIGNLDQSNSSGQVTQRKNTTTQVQTTGTGTTTYAQPAEEIRPWMVMGPLEWGFCNRTNQPKPPRAHYCHVSRGLVLCLDHYCPWMFNTVGYFNYRYFVNFLIFTTMSLLYAATLTYAPFVMLSTTKYREQLKANKHHHQVSESLDPLPRMEPFIPYAHEKMYVTLSFMLSLAVGIAVMMLCLFHIYLTITSQTTIEFHGNLTNARRAKKMGKKWKNPYDLGWKRNFQQVYGYQYHPLLAIVIPSSREPDFLPIPLIGDQGKRSTYASKGAPNRNNKDGNFIV